MKASDPNIDTGIFDDEVLREVRRIKEQLSAEYGHDVHKLFEQARARQRESGAEVVDFSKKPA